MFGNNGPSLADIAAVIGGNRSNNGGFGDGNGWWVLIILFAIFGGWGNGGYGNNGGGSRGSSNSGGGETVIVPYPTSGGCCNTAMGGSYGTFADMAAMQRGFDNQAVINKLDGINSGICNLGYDQLSQMNNINTTVMQTGNNLQTAMMQGNFGLQQAIQQDTIANMQNTNALASQLSNCCCENRAAIAQVRYDMSSDHCQTMNALESNTNAIVQNQNQNTQMLNNTIKDGFTALAMEAKDQQIASLTAQLNRSTMQSDLQGTASYIINSISPRSQPSFLTCNPNTGNVFPQSGMDQLRLAQMLQNQQNNCCQTVYN